MKNLPHTIQQLREEFEMLITPEAYLSHNNLLKDHKYPESKYELDENKVKSFLSHSHLTLLTALLEEVGEEWEYDPLELSDDAVAERGKRRLNEDRQIINQERSRLRSIIQSAIDSLKK